MKILMTGSTGFIGRSMQKAGFEVIKITSDITEEEQVSQEINDLAGNDEYTVIHAAAMTNVAACETTRSKWTASDGKERETYKANLVNVHGTIHVANAIGNKGRLLFLSSCHVYEGAKYFPYSETQSPSPVNLYGLTKMTSERLLDSSSLILRLGKVYSDETLDKISCLGDGVTVPSFIKRNFIHVDDVVRVIDYLCGIDWDKVKKYKDKAYYARILNIGNPDQNFSYDQFFNLVRSSQSRTPLEPRSQELPGYAPRPFRCTLNVKKLVRLLPKDFTFRSL